MDAHVYLVTNLINDKQYVGQTTVARNKVGHGLLVSQAYEKRGKENFRYEKLVSGIDSRDTLNFLEKFWIKVMDTRVPNGYNIEEGGTDKGEMPESTKEKLRLAFQGKPMAEETKLKISESLRGPKNHFYGKTHTPETVAKIVKANVGKKVVHSEETKRRIGAANSGSGNGMYGKKHPPEMIERFKARPPQRPWLGKKMSEEARAKMSASHKAKPSVQCPHCLKVGGQGGMKVHHFDNCKSLVH